MEPAQQFKLFQKPAQQFKLLQKYVPSLSLTPMAQIYHSSLSMNHPCLSWGTPVKIKYGHGMAHASKSLSCSKSINLLQYLTPCLRFSIQHAKCIIVISCTIQIRYGNERAPECTIFFLTCYLSFNPVQHLKSMAHWFSIQIVMYIT